MNPSPAAEPKKQPQAPLTAEKFWMVFVHKRQTPSHRHASLVIAYAEAKRLSAKLKKKAFVLEMIGSIEPPPEIVD
jgi:hypothetical protein